MEDVKLPLKRYQKRSLVLAVAVTLICPLWFGLAALGTKFGLWHFALGLVKMTFTWGPTLLMAATAVSVITLVLQLVVSPRRGAILALVTTLISGAMLWYFITSMQSALALPPIHDVQTDWSKPVNPPETLVRLRKEKGYNPILENPVVPEFAKGRWPLAVGKSNAELQQKYYGFLQPKISGAAMAEVFETALQTAKEQGLTIEEANESSGLIHASFTSTWYGFTDDILVRVSPVATGGSRLDIRSISRVGLSDLGANAARIKRYLEALDSK